MNIKTANTAAAIKRIQADDNCSRRSAAIAVANMAAHAAMVDEAARLASTFDAARAAEQAFNTHFDECDIRRCPECRALGFAMDTARAAHTRESFARYRAALA